VTKEPRTDGDGEMVTVRFEVKDNGIGISPEAQLKLFRPFMQADDTIIQRFGGTGLGLAISQKVAELMGSRIELSSCPGVGSTFSLQLTLPSCPPEAAVADSIDPASPGRSLHLLVVDDNPINVKVLKRMLETFSHRVTTAGDGAVALEILRHSEDVDMVFMDVHMPGMDGLEATRLLRKESIARLRNLPVIALTASITAESKAEAKDAGMTAYLTKPVNKAMLRSTLTRFVGSGMRVEF